MKVKELIHALRALVDEYNAADLEVCVDSDPISRVTFEHCVDGDTLQDTRVNLK